MADDTPRLPGRAEELLVAFPVPERDYEADARAVEQQLAITAIGSTASVLLDAPFPSDETREAARAALPTPPSALSALDALVKTPSRPSSTNTPPPSGRSLSDIARTVAQKPARKDSSELYKESLSVAAAARAQNDVVIERVKGARLRNERPEPPPAPVASRRTSLTPFLAGAALALAAAAFLLLLRGRDEAEAPRAATTAEVAPPVVARAPRPAVSVAEVPAPVANPMPPAITPDALPLAPAKPSSPETDDRVAAATPRGAAPASARPGAPASRPVPGSGTSGERVAGADPGTDPPAPDASALRPASGSRGGLPDKPSTGAAQAALGRVMGPARACIAGSTSPVLATVVFGASGSVAQVIVRGPAAATPAGACIQTALTQARVEPFASATFSVGVTVRP